MSKPAQSAAARSRRIPVLIAACLAGMVAQPFSSAADTSTDSSNQARRSAAQGKNGADATGARKPGPTAEQSVYLDSANPNEKRPQPRDIVTQQPSKYYERANEQNEILVEYTRNRAEAAKDVLTSEDPDRINKFGKDETNGACDSEDDGDAMKECVKNWVVLKQREIFDSDHVNTENQNSIAQLKTDRYTANGDLIREGKVMERTDTMTFLPIVGITVDKTKGQGYFVQPPPRALTFTQLQKSYEKEVSAKTGKELDEWGKHVKEGPRESEFLGRRAILINHQKPNGTTLDMYRLGERGKPEKDTVAWSKAQRHWITADQAKASYQRFIDKLVTKAKAQTFGPGNKAPWNPTATQRLDYCRARQLLVDNFNHHTGKAGDPAKQDKARLEAEASAMKCDDAIRVPREETATKDEPSGVLSENPDDAIYMNHDFIDAVMKGATDPIINQM